MKRFFISLSLSLILALIAFVGVDFFILKKTGRGALQVTSTPKSMVYLDGALIGETPLCRCEGENMLSTGEHAIRMVPFSLESKAFLAPPFEYTIRIEPSTLTVVDKTFGKGGTGDGSTLTLHALANKKEAQILVLSLPQTAEVALDSVLSGQTPVLLTHVTASDHEIQLKKNGYRPKTVRVKAIPGYKIEVVVFLGISDKEEQKEASLSSHLVPVPSKTVSVVVIQQTPTGYLNVRSNPPVNNVLSSKIGEVYPGDTLNLIEEENGWYHVTLSNGESGWISSEYAIKKDS